MSGLHNLRPTELSRRKSKRVGRGDGSNRGSYSGRGSKGQKQTGKVPFLFEGGQLPLRKRLPYMRGFTNHFRVPYSPVNIASLDRVFEEGQHITPELLYDTRLVRKPGVPVKLLGSGEISKKLTVTVHAVSASAREKIEKAGGTVDVISVKPESEGVEDSGEDQVAEPA